ncbi:hypothetical protein KDA_75370 [Dictyobacter alpinus]|uniref:Uncharacterized protein n=1 Tax=Dictyobacter alpinus TaxID=2014873 RepID=A0A402BL11_9CHLR|nr:hypothetical protein [Dictyobacter alpinus]GCE32053.1 hypothetical protein KDA_75370 [Dictyobacter alpinus]
MERKQRSSSGKAAAKGTPPPSLPTRPDRTVTIHPRVSVDENQIVKELAEQVNQPETTIWGDCASIGLLITLMKKGPNTLGMYGGRWSAKELAQEIRRRILNELIDFQYEQGELPGLLRDYMATLKTLAEQRQQGILVASALPGQQEAIPPTEEDELIFSAQGTDADSVNQSLGGMGFARLNLGTVGDDTTE